MNYAKHSSTRNTLTKDTPFDEVLQSVENMLWYICHSPKVQGLELEDLRQELCEQLWISWLSWDPSFGVQFSTYAFPALCNRRKMVIRRMQSQSRGRGKCPVSLESTEYGDNANSPMSVLMNILPDKAMDLDDYMELKDILCIISKTIENTRSESGKHILQDLLNGYTQIEVCKRNNCSQSLVSYHYKKFRQRLLTALKDNGYNPY